MPNPQSHILMAQLAAADARRKRQIQMKKNEYRMWPNGPTIELPAEYHWDAAAQEVVKNDLSWRGDLMAFWKLQHAS